ncbi:GNAT family N-acetyltransferase [Prosthecodimorpha staleyi]|uniref:GNAT family N-acetyltransferase n=1 Tax=Prosthecodimorpha staleyi TaxID=2840188 RepID=A0A947D4E6_9HYPH|nr:GNAT family N-acetyltransferase [Prosthecodimorpha staleyi]MBT9287997.1 GNAT family N-acetyltransferase [Prosthecodimorpha staleyi]
MTDATIRILPTAPEHRAAWDDLYAGYADFYRVTQTPAMRDTVWSWLMDPAHEVEGLVAVDAAGVPVGIAHFRAFARPLSATTGGFLDDLFVSEATRGSGTADALIARIAAIGRARGWSVIRWITAEDNARARKVYDRLAMKTRWVTYDLAL